MVCILKKGQIISQGPIGEVLSVGTDSIFTVEIEGNVEVARTALLGQPWVDRVEVDDDGASARLRITVNDPNAAETRLQRVLLEDETLIVKEFARHSASLEEVFVDLVEEGPMDD